MPKRPPSHEQRLREARPDLARLNQRAESREDRARRMADPMQVEANRIRHTAAWERARVQVLMEEPLCRRCTSLGVTTVATQVDHIEPLALRPDLATTRSNLQALCTGCHALKSAEERRADAQRRATAGPARKFSSEVESEATDA